MFILSCYLPAQQNNKNWSLSVLKVNKNIYQYLGFKFYQLSICWCQKWTNNKMGVGLHKSLLYFWSDPFLTFFWFILWEWIYTTQKLFEVINNFKIDLFDWFVLMYFFPILTQYSCTCRFCPTFVIKFNSVLTLRNSALSTSMFAITHVFNVLHPVSCWQP